ncbi:MAG: hypothetical protein DWH97_01735 [Planctomycetota bacterium]|nr:MAG: hypothetical protein DWH97_01735 [Planctomycetota bacterium]
MQLDSLRSVPRGAQNTARTLHTQSTSTAKTKPPAEVVRGERVRGLRVVGPAVVAMEDILMISSEPT